jgi:signal transduction histidine kinase
MTRLRWKLLSAMVALVVVTIGVSALFARQVSHEQVRRLLVKRPGPSIEQMVRPLEDHLRQAGGWRGVGAVVEQIAAVEHYRIVLATTDGEVIAVSGDLNAAKVAVDGEAHVTVVRERNGRREKLEIRAPLAMIRDPAGRPVARVYALPADDIDDPALPEIAAIDRRLLVIFAIATLVALALTALVSQRIVRPIEQLTHAVQQIARGQPARVEVRGRDEIARLAASFNAMADAVATQEALRRRMVGDIAHELRTPLTNLRCELEAIQDGLASPDAARIASLHEEVLHFQRLVEDLQELAVAEAGALVLQLERIDLGATVARIVGAQAEILRDDGIVVEVDVTRLRQIVHNLLANAVQHSSAGERVRVVVARSGGDATVSIRDRGPGIAAEDLDRIFERFYRVDQARGRAHGGAGLGLAIVRRLVELHGGRVWAESVEGQGATFTFTLPLASS